MGFGFRGKSAGFIVCSLGFRVKGTGFGAQGLGLRVWGSGLRARRLSSHIYTLRASGFRDKRVTDRGCRGND